MDVKKTDVAVRDRLFGKTDEQREYFKADLLEPAAFPVREAIP